MRTQPIHMPSAHLFSVAVAIAPLVFAASCASSMKVKRVDSSEVVDVSGIWNDSDAQMVAREVIADCLSTPWLEEFERRTGGERPVVVVGSFINKTDEHIQTVSITKALERAFVTSGRVRVVTSSDFRQRLIDEQKYQASGNFDDRYAASIGQQLGANFILFGTIMSIKDRWGKKEVVFYQVNVELHDTTTSEVVWIGEKKIKKVREQSRLAW